MVLAIGWFVIGTLMANGAPSAPAVNEAQLPPKTPSNDGSKAKETTEGDITVPAARIAAENETYQSLESFSRVLSLLETLYVDPEHVSTPEMIDKAIRGVVSSLDPHTTYLTAKDLREFTSDTTGKFGGIGVIIMQSEGRLEIVDVVEDSPGSRVGLGKGDIIYAVGQMIVTKTNLEDALSHLKGLPGSEVEITIIKRADFEAFTKLTPERQKAAGQAKLTKLKIKRAVIRTPSVKHAKLAPGYLYMHVAVFQEDTGEQADRILRRYEAENGGTLDGLVMDLRGNPGGLLDQAVRIADLFLDSGIIVSTIGRDPKKQEVEFASKRTTHPHMPIIVLVNEGTASASEIVAGALQDHDRALVLGTKTFGKGSVQSIIPLPNGAGLKMTIARYYTPKGRSIQAKGIVPDIPVPARKWSEEAPSGRKDARRESDLKGHIDAANISQRETMGSFEKDINLWEPEHKEDYQLRVAYTYLRGWARFDNKGNNRVGKKTPAAETTKPSDTKQTK
jgi:carboxyl-terminal processing protease